MDRPARLQGDARGHAGQVARGPARVRARVRPVLLPRRRGRGRPPQHHRGAARRRAAGTINLDTLRQQIAAALRDGSDAALRDLARLAIAAFGRGEGSGVLGVDVQRIRRALGLRAEPQPDLPEDDPRRRRRPTRAAATVRAASQARARARPDRAHREPPAQAPAERARPRAADGTDPGPRGRSPRRRTAQEKARHPGPRAQGPQAPRPRRRAADDAGFAPDRGVPVALKYRPQRPRRPEIFVLCDVSTSVTSASHVLPVASCTRSTTRSGSCDRSCSSSGSRR